MGPPGRVLERLRLPSDSAARLWQHGPTLANVVLTLLIAYTLALLTWRVWPAPPVSATPPPVAHALSAVTPPPGVSPNAAPEQMASWHLFGTAPSPTAAPTVLPTTALALTLRGVITGDRKVARAIISDGSDQEKFFALGSTVPGGAILKEILPTKIILQRGGGFETLLLPVDSLEGGPAPPPGMPGMPPGMMSPGMSPTGMPMMPSLREYRDQIAANPQKLGDLVRPVPVVEKGKFMGYRLLPGEDPGLLSRLGLDTNDIITGVNGTHIDSPAKGMGLLRNLPTQDEVRLELMRNGSPTSIVVKVN